MATSQLLDILDAPCFSSVNHATLQNTDFQTELLDRFWPLPEKLVENTDSFRAYFAFVEWECRNSRPSAHAASTFADLLAILNVVKANPTLQMSELRQKVRDSNQSFRNIAEDSRLSTSIELVVRLSFMINVRNTMPTDAFTLRTALPWPDSSSLQDIIQDWQKQVSLVGQQPIKPNFPSIPDLERIAGFTIRWTNDLASHLEVDNQTLYVFHHVTVLKRIQESDSSDLISRDFIEETLNTIKLILPVTRPDCNAWIGKVAESYSIDPNISLREGITPNSVNFLHWGYRLATLSEIFDRSIPSTFTQFWFDRRDMSKWWGFWMIVITVFLTVLFGLIQSVAGIMQVVISMRDP